MIKTAAIQTALLAALRASGLFEKVFAHADNDLAAALEHLRDNPSSVCVVVPGSDEFDHTLEPDTNTPVRCEISNRFDLLISGRQLDKRETGDPKTLETKDSTIALLGWEDLGVSGLLCLPEATEPLAIEFENGKGREAWKISLLFRQSL